MQILVIFTLMRKKNTGLFLLLISLIMVIFITGCGKKEVKKDVALEETNVNSQIPGRLETSKGAIGNIEEKIKEFQLAEEESIKILSVNEIEEKLKKFDELDAKISEESTDDNFDDSDINQFQ